MLQKDKIVFGGFTCFQTPLHLTPYFIRMMLVLPILKRIIDICLTQSNLTSVFDKSFGDNLFRMPKRPNEA